MKAPARPKVACEMLMTFITPQVREKPTPNSAYTAPIMMPLMSDCITRTVFMPFPDIVRIFPDAARIDGTCVPIMPPSSRGISQAQAGGKPLARQRASRKVSRGKIRYFHGGLG